MAILYEIKKRRVIPNWRDFGRTVNIGELASSSSKNSGHININADRAEQDWRDNKTVGVAADLINSSFIAGKTNSLELSEAINFIFDNEHFASKPLLDIAYRINGLDKTMGAVPIETSQLELNTFNEFESYFEDESGYRYIRSIKNQAHSNLHNPIIWVELARAYSIFGQEKKSEKAMQTALNLAPNNRFVLRSATRLFAHTQNHEKALFYLKKSELIKNDPWLISAHIATSSMIDRYSPFIKRGISIIESKNFSDYDTTELASSIGTLEFLEGSFKKTRKYIDLSLISPNDNSLAQIEWLANHDKRFDIDPFSYKNVINPFEAHALEKYEKGDWQDALNETVKWFLDMPYSKRPILLGSYISGSLMKDNETAINLCKAGLRANPHDPMILNNIVYQYVIDNKLDDAWKYIEDLKRINITSLPNETRIVLQATFGLISYRTNNIQQGRDLYSSAISNAKRIKNKNLENLALINLGRELILINNIEKEDIINKIKNIKISNDRKGAQFLQNDVLNLYKEKKT